MSKLASDLHLTYNQSMKPLTQHEAQAIRELRQKGHKRKEIMGVIGCTLSQYKGVIYGYNYVDSTITRVSCIRKGYNKC